jgi:DNA-binding NarL/FixJ family response regulator
VLVLDTLLMRRAGLVRLLHGWAETAGLGTLAGAPDDLAAVQAADVRLVVLALGSLPVASDTCRRWIGLLKQGWPEAPLVLLSDRDNPQEGAGAFRAGAQGFIPTSSEPALALQALSFILAGGSFFPPSALVAPGGREGRPARGVVRRRRRSGLATRARAPCRRPDKARTAAGPAAPPPAGGCHGFHHRLVCQPATAR